MRTLFIALTLALSTGPVACSSSGGGSSGPSRSRDVITLEELQPHTSLNVLEAIRRLRPRWLQARGGGTSGQDYPQVILDGSRFGDINTLSSFQVSDVQELRFMNPRDATTRWGTGFPGGAIVINTRS